MIKALIDLLFGIPTWLIEQLPTVTLPAFFSASGPGSAGAMFQTVASALGSMNGWVPVDQLPAAFSLLAASLAAALVIWVLRMVVSHLTGGGGGL